MNKIILFGTLLLLSFNVFSQQENDTVNKTKLKINGGFESIAQRYVKDDNRKILQPDDPFRSNNYLLLNVNYGKFTVGTQIESYYEQALLNYNPAFEGTGFSMYHANYRSSKLDITAGYFFEQFGSGLLLRGWEDRALGINTALRGGRINYKPIDGVSVTGIYGRQKSGFVVSQSDIFGLNTDLDLSTIFNKENFGLTAGFSYILKNEEINREVENPNFSALTAAYSARIGITKGGFYASSEYNYREPEPIFQPTTLTDYNFVKPGNALLINFGYSERGLGIDATLRRMENMTFLSNREPIVYPSVPGRIALNSLEFGDRVINFTPALTKQHHSNLANIYVYQAQNRVSIDPSTGIMKAGEIGGQFDIFYNFEKGTSLGGKYGTKVALNVSNWFNLDADYTFGPDFAAGGGFRPDYDAKFFGGSQKFFSDYNLEIAKKFSKKFRGIMMYANQYYNDQYIRGIFKENVVKTNIILAEGIYTFSGSRSITVGAEHMWADNDRGNWASLLLEYNHNINWSIFVMDMYNYGFDNKDNLIAGPIDTFKIHFYNTGVTYRKNSSRFSLGYGRQRGGLVCAGGVCRFVPPSTGVSFTISTTF
jgi:hypothetical protein